MLLIENDEIKESDPLKSYEFWKTKNEAVVIASVCVLGFASLSPTYQDRQVSSVRE